MLEHNRPTLFHTSCSRQSIELELTTKHKKSHIEFKKNKYIH